MNKYPPPPKNWSNILIELEIEGVVVNKVTACQSTYQALRNDLTNEGLSQLKPWQIFISRVEYSPAYKNIPYNKPLELWQIAKNHASNAKRINP